MAVSGVGRTPPIHTATKSARRGAHCSYRGAARAGCDPHRGLPPVPDVAAAGRREQHRGGRGAAGLGGAPIIWGGFPAVIRHPAEPEVRQLSPDSVGVHVGQCGGA